MGLTPRNQTVIAMAIHMNTKLNKTTEPLKLQRLLQLCSANLPVGGFSFSQGLEFAIEEQWINDAESTKQWISCNLSQSIAHTDLAILKPLYSALIEGDLDLFIEYNQLLIACRESAELRLADVAMGKALVRLLNQLEGINRDGVIKQLAIKEISFVSAFSLAAYLSKLDLLEAQSGFCWTYIDNQVAAATKLVPLGQTQSQNMLFALSEQTESAIDIANSLALEDIGASLPRLAMASAWHETQYTRLFRS
jgi:urease accessory protein